MPRRTIYVSDNDQELFEQATQEARDLSPAIAIVLREYVARAKLRHEGMDTIDLTIDDHDVSHTIRLTGRKLFRLAEKTDNGVRVRFVYITKQGRYIVHEKITTDPEDWEGQGERLWHDPVTWTCNFWLRSDWTLDIFDTLDQLREKDPELADRVAVAQEALAPRELDTQALLRRPCPVLFPDTSGPEYGTGPTSIHEKYMNTHCPGSRHQA